MAEVILNQNLAEVLIRHGIDTTVDDEFIYANLPSRIKLKARAVYTEINGYISSQLDVMVIAPDGEMILESFGDFGKDVESAISNNLTNFNISSLHPLLAAFGADNQEIIDQITIEEWEISNKKWIAYIGNLIPKTNSKDFADLRPPEHFFNAITTGIVSQTLNNNLHWFRGFYSQYNNEITITEFTMDNENITSSNPLFSSIPVIPDIEFYSCRNFIILTRK